VKKRGKVSVISAGGETADLRPPLASDRNCVPGERGASAPRIPGKGTADLRPPLADDYKIVLVTDRVDLDDQIYRTFSHCDLEPHQARSGKDLAKQVTGPKSRRSARSRPISACTSATTGRARLTRPNW